MKRFTKQSIILIFLAVLTVSFLGCGNKESATDLGDGWKSYHHKKIGLTVKIPVDSMVKIGSKWGGEAPINNVWFSDGVFSSIESDKYIGVGTLIRGDANTVREKLIKYSTVDDAIVDHDDVKIMVQQFYVQDIPVFFVRYKSRLDVYVAGDEYLHYAKVNRDFLHQHYAELDNLSAEAQNSRYIEILKNHILAVNPF